MFTALGPGGTLGLKVEELLLRSKLLESVGLQVPGGWVIGSKVPQMLIQEYGLEPHITAEELATKGCPVFLKTVNEKLLDFLESGKPYAIRSSALAESGGIGIYQTKFFWCTGDRKNDLETLWRCECEVYASELSLDAELWRKRANIESGMAIFVQPVIGFTLGDNFLPVLSGVAYTSLNGSLTVRAVPGLGTLAVRGGGVVYYSAPEEFLGFMGELWGLMNMDAIYGNEIVSIPANAQEFWENMPDAFKVFRDLFKALETLKQSGNFYLEWVIANGKIYVVQCAPYEDHPVVKAPLKCKEPFLLLSGADVLHEGHVLCEGIVYVKAWTSEVSRVLESLNTELDHYLLIIPEAALSTLANIPRLNEEMSVGQLSYRHFSNAAAVIERQVKISKVSRQMLSGSTLVVPEHSKGLGATHFAQLCKRSDILFIGTNLDVNLLYTIPGATEYYNMGAVVIWNVECEVVVADEIGNVFVDKATFVAETKFTLYQIQEWSGILRDVANSLIASDEDNAEHFYSVHYAIGPEANPMVFSQYDLDDEVVKEYGGMSEFLISLKKVIDHGANVIDPEVWDDGLAEYLQKLYEHYSAKT